MSMKLAEAFVTITVDTSGVAQDLRGVNTALKNASSDMNAATQASTGTSKAMRDLANSAKQVFESTRTPIERFNAHISELDKLLRAGAISQDTHTRALQLAKKELADATGFTARLKAEQQAQALAAATSAAQQKRAQEEIANSATRVFNATRTATERYEVEIQNLRRLLKAGAIDQDTFNRAVMQARGGMTTATRSTGKLGMVLQQASFGAQDFIQVYGPMGLTGALRASANNWSQVLAVINPFAGAIGGIAIAIGTILIPELLKMDEKAEESVDKVDELRKKIDELRESSKNAIEFRFRMRDVMQDIGGMTSEELESRQATAFKEARGLEADEQAISNIIKQLATPVFGEVRAGFLGLSDTFGQGGSFMEQLEAARRDNPNMNIEVSPEVREQISELEREMRGLGQRRRSALGEFGEIRRRLPEVREEEFLAQQEQQRKEIGERGLEQEVARDEMRQRQEEIRRGLARDVLSQVNPDAAQLLSIRNELEKRVQDIKTAFPNDREMQQRNIEAAQSIAQKQIQDLKIELPGAGAAQLFGELVPKGEIGSPLLEFLSRTLDDEMERAVSGLATAPKFPDDEKEKRTGPDRVGVSGIAGLHTSIQQQLRVSDSEKAVKDTATNTKKMADIAEKQLKQNDQIIQGIDRMNSMPNVATFS